MMRAHAQLHSKSESEVQQALRVIRSQLFKQIGADRKWRSGGSIAIMNLKALEVVLLKIDAKDRVDGSLTELERYVLRNAMQIIYDLRSFSDLRAELGFRPGHRLPGSTRPVPGRFESRLDSTDIR
ncbi:hypothetical protein PGT21_009660 [Puccinia graminis f. sp. tritici]|uniref:Uncharacterized protein n=1 Tax=Puccinia graminis f. sp. tritici TaxID=56615 RepID=A0A5B0QI90_PUCGR|nr:hypothetical protein PGT21_009660 [Puccinia graminis f. sp. tritici]